MGVMKSKAEFDAFLDKTCNEMRELHLTAEEYKEKHYREIDSQYPTCTNANKRERDAKKAPYLRITKWLKECGYLDEQGYLTD